MLLRFRSLVALLILSSSLVARAGEPTQEREVELFAAMEAGEIEAEVIAPSARQIFLRVDNKTTEMLRIKLPRAFAAVPVLAQMQPGLFPGGGLGPGANGQIGLGQPGLGQGLGLGQNQGGSQGLGGGFNGPGQGNQFGNGIGNQFGNQFGNPFGNGQNNGIGRGLFRVPAGRVGKVAAQTFCLEHGKPDPTSKVKYRIVPIEDFVGKDERIASLCRLLADRTISQNVAQAAAWNLANGVSFDQMASMNRVQSKYTGNVRMFSDDELKMSLKVVEKLNTDFGVVDVDVSLASRYPKD